MSVTKVEFDLNLSSGNAAMVDDPSAAVAEILEAVAKKIRSGLETGKCMDGNGNRVGDWGLSIEEEDDESEDED